MLARQHRKCCLADLLEILTALNAMASGGFRHLPIGDDGLPTGIITAGDLFRYISSHLV